MKNKKWVIKLVIILSVIILLSGTIFVGIFTNWFSTKLVKSFIKINNKIVINKISNIVLSPEKSNSFEIKSPLLINKNRNYSISIVPIKADQPIEFTVNGFKYYFNNEDELTDYFNISYKLNSFNIDGNFTIKTILEKKYPGCDIKIDNKYINSNDDLFTLNIKIDDNPTLCINFRSYIDIEGISIKEKIIFEELENGKVIIR